MRPFMKKEMQEMVSNLRFEVLNKQNKRAFQLFIHPDPLDSFYKYVPKECLPSDYGGQDEPSNILQGKPIFL